MEGCRKIDEGITVMKIVVLGAGGMLGSMVACVAASRSDLEVVATLRDQVSVQGLPVDAAGIQWRALDVEVATSSELTELLRDASWVINAIGVIKPYIRDTDAASVQRAILVNSLFPQVLATVAEECGCRVLQIATDCVYSGTSGGYCEDAPHDALRQPGRVHDARRRDTRAGRWRAREEASHHRPGTRAQHLVLGAANPCVATLCLR